MHRNYAGIAKLAADTSYAVRMPSADFAANLPPFACLPFTPKSLPSSAAAIVVDVESATAFTGSSARCAYRAVVEAWR